MCAVDVEYAVGSQGDSHQAEGANSLLMGRVFAYTSGVVTSILQCFCITGKYKSKLPWGHPPRQDTQKDGAEFVPVQGMSAVCYYYGVEMTKKNASVPVGLIASSWGGTRIQVWMDGPALKSCGASAASNIRMVTSV